MYTFSKTLVPYLSLGISSVTQQSWTAQLYLIPLTYSHSSSPALCDTHSQMYVTWWLHQLSMTCPPAMELLFFYTCLPTALLVSLILRQHFLANPSSGTCQQPLSSQLRIELIPVASRASQSLKTDQLRHLRCSGTAYSRTIL